MSASSEANALPNPLLNPLPSRPKINLQNPHVHQIRSQGLPTQTADMLWALDKGLYYLALCIAKMDRDGIEFSQSVFKVSNNAVQGIMDVILSMSEETIQHAITGTLHKLVFTSTDSSRLPRDHRINSHIKERPVIYTLVHCSDRGIPPTKKEYLEVLKDIEVYIGTFHAEERWRFADELANEIDYANPGTKDNDWVGKNREKSTMKWKRDEHPRRYLTSSNRGPMITFIRALRARLRLIAEDKENDPLDWSLVYTGWTKNESQRAYQHAKHIAGSNIA